MKKLCVALAMMVFSLSASAGVTVYGGINKYESYDLGFQGGANLTMGMFGVDASYTMMSLGNTDTSIIEVMPIVKFGSKIFLMAGAGLEFITVKATNVPIFGTIELSSTEFGVMAGAGLELGSMLVVDARVRLINSTSIIAANLGLRF